MTTHPSKQELELARRIFNYCCFVDLEGNPGTSQETIALLIHEAVTQAYADGYKAASEPRQNLTPDPSLPQI